MNCIRFEEKLYDYIEDETDGPTSEEMERHIEACTSCKEKYEIKLSLQDSLKEACSVERKGLSSVRKYVIGRIDKNKYNKKLSNRLYYLFSRLREQCEVYLHINNSG